jgi:hypothetical protein
VPTKISAFNLNDLICFMSDNTSNTSSINTVTQTQNSTTTTQIIHNDGSFSNTIRTLFIYGTGALRFGMLRHRGSPGSNL